ncbi:hypothetical protein H650_11210 [Enterobacter sp. R4-368]|nr:hypothetical protein H650_11210 [Enterobacter sp. R4-368]
MFDKISERDLFGKHNTYTVNHLNMIYNKSILNIGNKRLIITNDFLENKNICSMEYVKLKKSTLSYFMSAKTVNMYSVLFKYENIQFPEDVYEITSLFPGKECPVPYDAIVKVGSNLFVTDQDYVVFYKQSNVIASQDNALYLNNNWGKYCHNRNVESQFDGTSEYVCIFDNMGINESYQEVISFDENASGKLSKILPNDNNSYKANGSSVDYKWIDNDRLKILVVMDSETTSYYFNKNNTGTNLHVLVEAQY